MYVDKVFYIDTYQGDDVENFEALELRAAEIVEEMTLYRLTPLTFAAMPEAVQVAVKKAVCAEIEYLDANGGADLDNGGSLQSGSLGKFSFTQGSGGMDGEAGQPVYSPRALRLLAPTGLLYRGGGC